MTVSDEQLRELERLERAATAAPWAPPSWQDDPRDYEPDFYLISSASTPDALDVASGGYEGGGICQRADADFIVALRNAAPDLLAEVRRLRTILTDVLDQIDAIDSMWPDWGDVDDLKHDSQLTWRPALKGASDA